MSNTTTQFNADPELFKGFLDDSLESLEALELAFINLESNPNDLEVIDEVFRPIHSIKGNAAFFSLMKIKDFAHQLETLLDKIRKGQIPANHNIVDLLLRSVDELKNMLIRVSQGQEEVADESQRQMLSDQLDNAVGAGSLDEYIRRLSGCIEKVLFVAQKANLAQIAPKVINEVEMMAKANQSLIDMIGDESGEQKPQEKNTTDKDYYFDDININNEIKNLDAILGNQITGKSIDDAITQVQMALEDLQKKVTDQAGDLVEAMLDDYHTMVNSAVGFDDLLRGILAEKLEQLKTLLHTQPTQKDSSQSSGKKQPDKSAATSQSKTQQLRTMRVSEEKIDDFMKYVGDLIMVNESLNNLQRKLIDSEVADGIINEFRQTNSTFRSLSDKLQFSLLEIRKVPARGLVQKIPRMVRDLAEKLNKKIVVDIAGEDILIDKTLLEALGDPITHMVRNCVDHGIATPQKRLDAGKSQTGTISINLKQKNEMVTFTISDDGNGIDPNKIRAKAIEKGLIRNSESLTNRQILQLIFASGLSTAEKVSDVSGRGVGMDVVRTNVEKLNGTIEIDSEIGKGTQITLKLPANSTAVVESFILAGVGQHFFLVPLKHVRELLRPTEEMLYTIQNRGEFLNLRDQLYSLLRIPEIFDIKSQHSNPSHGMVIIVEADHKQAALFVDEIYGQQRAVTKNLDGELINLPGIAGAAILGNGHIGIVTDIAALIENRCIPC